MDGARRHTGAPAVVVGTGVALAEAYPQTDVRDAVASAFDGLAAHRYLAMFDNSGITTRRLVRPPAWYATHATLAERSAIAVDEGVALAAGAARRALEVAGTAPSEVDAVVVASTTVVRTPGIDVDLVAALGLRSDVRRLVLGASASLGGAQALALGADLVAAGHGTVLVVCAEVNSMAFTPSSWPSSTPSAEAVVTMALFSDGAAAVVVRNEADVPSAVRTGSLCVLGSHATLVPDTTWVMGFDVGDHGLTWRLAPEVPEVAAGSVAASVDAALAGVDWTRGDLAHLIVHPGGVRVVAAALEALGLDMASAASALGVLEECGNLSGATVLAVLDRHLAGGARPGPTLLMAMGPGFGFEHVLLGSCPS